VVADHIMVEYSRTAVIAHISQATKGWQEGWGRPGRFPSLSGNQYNEETDDRDQMGESTFQDLHPINPL
jgi:hypothetical protein